MPGEDSGEEQGGYTWFVGGQGLTGNEGTASRREVLTPGGAVPGEGEPLCLDPVRAEHS